MVTELSILVSGNQTIMIEEGKRPELHPFDLNRCLGSLEEGRYDVSVFKKAEEAITHQEKLYGKDSEGYRYLVSRFNKPVKSKR